MSLGSSPVNPTRAAEASPTNVPETAGSCAPHLHIAAVAPLYSEVPPRSSCGMEAVVDDVILTVDVAVPKESAPAVTHVAVKSIK